MTLYAHAIPATGGDNPFTPGKLMPGVHDPLVADLERVALEAGITVEDITGRNYSLTGFEIDYLRGFRKTGMTGAAGLIYIGAHQPSVAERQRSSCGALLRNFITARFIVREELVSELFDRRRNTRAEFVAVPDFSYRDASTATRRALASWVMGRIARGQQTSLGVPDKSALSDLFGDEAKLYLKHFAVLYGVNTPA